MKRKTIALGVVGLVGTGLVAGAVSAAGPGFGHDKLQNEDVKLAVQNNDYDAFVQAVSEIDPEAVESLTEERFAKMVERSEIRDEIDQAIENNDYDAWVEAVSKTPRGEQIAQIVSQDEFDEYIEMHQAKEKVRELAQEIGLDELKKERKGKGFGKGGFGRH